MFRGKGYRFAVCRRGAILTVRLLCIMIFINITYHNTMELTGGASRRRDWLAPCKGGHGRQLRVPPVRRQKMRRRA